MLKISKDGTIKLTRGDTALLKVDLANVLGDSVEKYEIAKDDILTFTVKKNTRSIDECISISVIGEDTFRIAPEDTSSLEFGKYVYDIQLTTSEGDVYTPVEPTVFEILEEVTY